MIIERHSPAATTHSVLNMNVNLLVALHVLLKERNVTRAARALGISQSTLSGSLAKLRELFGDPLLIRQGRGMQPTSRALDLAEQLQRGVDALDRALTGARFDPLQSRETFVLALSDRSEMLLLAPILERLRTLSPGVRLQILPWGHLEPPGQLSDGSIDLHVGMVTALSGEPETWPSGPAALNKRLRADALFETGLVSVLRRGHPALRNRLTLKRFCELEHILVTEQLGGQGIVDDALTRQKMRRHIALRLPRYAPVAEVLARSDYIATIDRRVAERLAKQYPLKIVKPPVPLPSGMMSMVWHERTDTDPARAWLRHVVREAATQLRAKRCR